MLKFLLGLFNREETSDDIPSYYEYKDGDYELRAQCENCGRTHPKYFADIRECCPKCGAETFKVVTAQQQLRRPVTTGPLRPPGHAVWEVYGYKTQRLSNRRAVASPS